MVSEIISNKYDIWKTNTVIFLTCNSKKYVDTRYLQQMCNYKTVSFLVSKQFPKQRTSIWKHQFGKPVGKLVSNIHFFQLFTSFHQNPSHTVPRVSKFSQGSSSTKFSSKAFSNAEAPRSEISLLLRSKEKSKDWLRSTFRRNFMGQGDVKGTPGDPRGWGEKNLNLVAFHGDLT